MNKTFLIIFLFCLHQAFCQDKSDENLNKAYIEVFGKCFEDLKTLEETKDIPALKKISFCSLYQCVSRIQNSEIDKNIEQAILKRATEITTRLYNEGTPIYLIGGSMSWRQADINNQDLTDDNNLIYVSISDCISSNALVKIAKIVNEETSRLINKK